MIEWLALVVVFAGMFALVAFADWLTGRARQKVLEPLVGCPHGCVGNAWSFICTRRLGPLELEVMYRCGACGGYYRERVTAVEQEEEA